MVIFVYSILLSLLVSLSKAQEPGLVLPLTTNCCSSSNAVCLTKYLSVLPYHFYRPAANGSTPVTIDEIQWPDNYSATANAISSADFLVFDAQRGLEILGSNPTYDYMFNVSAAVHEAPVYWPAGNRLFMSQLAPPPGVLPQLEVNLDNDPPTLSEFLSNPPVYAPNGGTFHDGLVYWGLSFDRTVLQTIANLYTQAPLVATIQLVVASSDQVCARSTRPPMKQLHFSTTILGIISTR